MTENQTQKRIFELDALRGIAVIAMIIDHFTYLLFEFYIMTPKIFSNFGKINPVGFRKIVNVLVEFQLSSFRDGAHYVFCTIFLLLVGISCTFSKNNLLRGLKVGIGAAIISVATIIISLVIKDNYSIIFGILHLICVSILLFHLVQKLYPNKWLYLIIGSFLIIWGFLIKWWDAPFIGDYRTITFVDLFKIILGYKVYGADHFGIIPCTGVVFVGAFLGELLYKKRQTLFPKLDKAWHKPFTYVGRHALLIYLFHQVVSIVVIVLMFLLAGYRF